MTEITEPKIGFKRFPGFSLLFDNPGTQQFSPLGSHFIKIDCRMDVDPHLALYAHLRTRLDALNLQARWKDYLFFDLPASSYHVTVWDGLHSENAHKVRQAFQPDLTEFLVNLPSSLLGNYEFLSMPSSSPLITSRRSIMLQFTRLAIWKTALVALLEPINDSSRRTLEEIKDTRHQLYHAFKGTFGLQDWRRSYDPHVSLGYFGNERCGQTAKAALQEWNTIFSDHAGGSTTIQFTSISLYGFLDMTTFFTKS